MSNISASSKHKLIELEQQVTNLTEKLMESDQEKEQLKMELRSANISLQDVQQRLHTLQVTKYFAATNISTCLRARSNHNSDIILELFINH